MKTKIVFLGFFLFFSIINFSNAQIGNYMKSKAVSATKRAGQQSDKEVDKKINNAVDEEVSKLFNKKKGDKDQPESNETQPAAVEQSSAPSDASSSSSGSNAAANDAMSKAIMGRMGISMARPANVKDSYNYTGNLLMVIQSWDDEGDTDGEVLYTTHYTSDNKGVAMDFKSKDKGDSKIIFDNVNNIMIILGDNGKDKSGFVMGVAPTDTTAASAQANTSGNNNTTATSIGDYYSNFKKTGRTKTIAGYSCEEFEYEDAESKATYWITNEMPADLWAKMFSANMITSVYAGRPNGFIMETYNEKKNSKSKSTMIVKEVNKNQAASISTVGYTFVSYGGNPAAAPK
jgi:hypothetical protein